MREGWSDDPVGEFRSSLSKVRGMRRDAPDAWLKELVSRAESGRVEVLRRVEELLKNPTEDSPAQLLSWLFPGVRVLGSVLKFIITDLLHVPAIGKFFVRDFPLMIGDVAVSSAKVLTSPGEWPAWVRFLVAVWNFAKTPIVLTMVGAMKFTIPWQKQLMPDLSEVQLFAVNAAACWGLFAIFLGVTWMGKVNLLKPVAAVLGQLFPSRMLPKQKGMGPTWSDVGKTAGAAANDPQDAFGRMMQKIDQYRRNR